MIVRFASLAVLLTIAFNAMAHDTKGPHGGRLTDADTYHMELVIKSDVIEIFISDTNERPLASSGFSAVALLAAGGKSQRTVLTPVESDRLAGKLSIAFSSEPKGIVQLTSPDGKTSQAKFN